MRPPADAGAFGPTEYRPDAAFTAPGRQGQRQEAPLPPARGPGLGRRPAAARGTRNSCRGLDNNNGGELDYPLTTKLVGQGGFRSLPDLVRTSGFTRRAGTNGVGFAAGASHARTQATRAGNCTWS